jgi:hypothetical protein
VKKEIYKDLIPEENLNASGEANSLNDDEEVVYEEEMQLTNIDLDLGVGEQTPLEV